MKQAHGRRNGWSGHVQEEGNTLRDRRRRPNETQAVSPLLRLIKKERLRYPKKTIHEKQTGSRGDLKRGEWHIISAARKPPPPVNQQLHSNSLEWASCQARVCVARCESRRFGHDTVRTTPVNMPRHVPRLKDLGEGQLR